MMSPSIPDIPRMNADEIAKRFELELATAILVTAASSADYLGEALRSFVFPGPGLGCYSAFETREGFVEVDRPEQHLLFGAIHEHGTRHALHSPHAVQGTTVKSNGWLDVAWYWDGDGVLAFWHRATGVVVRNEDCKKSRWTWNVD